MHELGVVFHVIDELEDIAKENDVARISHVTLEIGEVSTVIPDMLRDVWNWAIKKHEILKDSELTIKRIPAITYCTACRETYETVQYGKTCPLCGSTETYLKQGNEFIIEEIEVVDREKPAEGPDSTAEYKPAEGPESPPAQEKPSE